MKDTSGGQLIPDRVIITKLLTDKLEIQEGEDLRVISDNDMRGYALTIDTVADSAAGEFVFLPLEDLNAMLDVRSGAY